VMVELARGAGGPGWVQAVRVVQAVMVEPAAGTGGAGCGYGWSRLQVRVEPAGGAGGPGWCGWTWRVVRVDLGGAGVHAELAGLLGLGYSGLTRGNMMSSLMLKPVNMISSRSMPMPMPPAGGMASGSPLAACRDWAVSLARCSTGSTSSV
jgi:hypothetical protein